MQYVMYFYIFSAIVIILVTSYLAYALHCLTTHKISRSYDDVQPTVREDLLKIFFDENSEDKHTDLEKRAFVNTLLLQNNDLYTTIKDYSDGKKFLYDSDEVFDDVDNGSFYKYSLSYFPGSKRNMRKIDKVKGLHMTLIER